jgi:bacterioferritin-associated ferredoxin
MRPAERGVSVKSALIAAVVAAASGRRRPFSSPPRTSRTARFRPLTSASRRSGAERQPWPARSPGDAGSAGSGWTVGTAGTARPAGASGASGARGIVNVGYVELISAEVDPASMSEIRAFIATGSTSAKCLMTANESSVALPETSSEIYCGSRSYNVPMASSCTSCCRTLLLTTCSSP